MNLKKLNDKQLLDSTIKTVKEERKWTTLVLEHLQEVENRKLYCELKVNSLYAYCTKILGYSEAEASIRVNATRLIAKTPVAKKAIESGELSLTNASYAQSFFREHQTSDSDKINVLDEYLEKKKAAKSNRPERGSQNQRYIARKAREAVYVRAHGRCESTNSMTKERCPARTHLEYDHIRPIAAGGSSDEGNIQLLCRNCNQRRWVKYKNEDNLSAQHS